METALYKAVFFHLWEQRRVPVCSISVFSKSCAEPGDALPRALTVLLINAAHSQHQCWPDEHGAHRSCISEIAPRAGRRGALGLARSLAERQRGLEATMKTELSHRLVHSLRSAAVSEMWGLIQSSSNWQYFQISHTTCKWNVRCNTVVRRKSDWGGVSQALDYYSVFQMFIWGFIKHIRKKRHFLRY